MGNLLGPLLITVCGILRSTDLFFRTSVIKQLPILQVVTWEHMIGSIVILPVFLINAGELKKLKSFKEVFSLIFICTGSSVLGIFFFTKAFQNINPALVVLVQKTQPVFTILLSAALLKETITKRFFFYSALAIISSYFMLFSLQNPFSSATTTVWTGIGYSFLAAFFWGGGTAFGKILLGKLSKNFMVSVRYVFGFLFAFLMFNIAKGSTESFSIHDWSVIFSLVYMALIPGFLALVFFYRGLKLASASLAAIFELVFPLSSVAVMWIFFGYKLDNIQILSAAVLLFSMTMLVKKLP